MPRKKKVEEPEKIEETIIEKTDKPVDYGTGWVRVNNMLQAGFTIEEIRRTEK